MVISIVHANSEHGGFYPDSGGCGYLLWKDALAIGGYGQKGGLPQSFPWACMHAPTVLRCHC